MTAFSTDEDLISCWWHCKVMLLGSRESDWVRESSQPRNEPAILLLNPECKQKD